MSIRAVTWNLNCRNSPADLPPVPSWVAGELAGADIAVLTEAPRVESESRRDLVEELERAGYRCAASENEGGNDVLIAARQDHEIVSKRWVPSYALDDIPENLALKVNLKGSGPLTVWGVRIKNLASPNNDELRRLGRVDVDQAKRRRAEFQRLLAWLGEDSGPMIVSGDFNTYREYFWGAEIVKPWNSRVLRELAAAAGLDMVCPGLGSSIGEERSPVLFKPDRFLTRGLSLAGAEPEYSRDFTARDTTVYTHGRNFRGNIQPGYPDHALLTAQFRLAG